MNTLILCEGSTDAILLSYYLIKNAGWKYERKSPTNLSIKSDYDNEAINWYKRGKDYLLICAVGGKDKFASFFGNKIRSPLVKGNAFSQLIVVTDRDKREISEIEQTFENVFPSIRIPFKNREWKNGEYYDSYGEIHSLKSLLIVIPSEKEGALETVILDSIAEDSYDKTIVKRTSEYSKEMRKLASRYIVSDRIQLKAHLSLTWAVMNPERTFTLFDERIKSMNWTNSQILHDTFSVLLEI